MNQKMFKEVFGVEADIYKDGHDETLRIVMKPLKKLKDYHLFFLIERGLNVNNYPFTAIVGQDNMKKSTDIEWNKP